MDKSAVFANKIENAYKKSLPEHYHYPTLQLNSINKISSLKAYMPVPKISERFLFSHGSKEFVRPRVRYKISVAKKEIIEHNNFVNNFFSRIIDKNRDTMEKYVREIGWRISPASYSTLFILGASYDEAFGYNRTAIMKRFKKLGYAKLSNDYASFYIYAWKYYLSKDFKYLKKCLHHGHAALKQMIEIAEKK